MFPEQAKSNLVVPKLANSSHAVSTAAVYKLCGYIVTTVFSQLATKFLPVYENRK